MRQPIPFGKYYLLERINVGGMAEVFKAKATGVEGFERLVAVKRILPSIAEDEEFITMFKDEAKIAVQLNHANIAQIFDLGLEAGSFFIALEYVHGKDLRAIFNRARQRGELLPIPMSCFAIMKLCEGLDYAHNKHDASGTFLNLVHRDVSPQNILVSYEGEVKIIDFGIAKAVGKSGRTQAGILKGKFGYMSPEQVLGLEIDRRSDVFGVGICLYELLTGERLFVAESDFATLEKVRAVDIMPPSTYNRRIPEELEQIVMRALARDRDRRYQTALQLHDDLQAFIHTSANLYSRKDLNAYMHRVFAEEIEKESARDREYATMDPAGNGHDDGGPGVFDQMASAPANAVGAKAVGALSSGPNPRASNAPARSRNSTLLGIPHLAMRGPEAGRAPSVPRMVPSPQSVPPTIPRPSRPPRAGLGSNPNQTPLLQGPRGGHGHGAMEWDDEELSTQIYDKPDSQPPMRGRAPSKRSRPPVQANNSKPPFVPRAPTPVPGAVSRPAPFVPSPPAPPVTLREQPPAWEQKSKGRPMFVAVVTVMAIIACIVMALMLFGQKEPGTVHLTTTPGRVAVTVDGRPLGMSTSPFVISELSAKRRHSIQVSSAGYRSWSSAVELEPGQVLALPQVHLERIETGFALESVPTAASVFIDGQRIAQATPARVTDLAPGEHRIRVELEGYAPWESALHATTGTVLPLQAVTLQPLAAEQRARPTRTWHRAVPTASAESPGDDTAAPGPESSANASNSASDEEAEEEQPDSTPAAAITAPNKVESSESGTGTLRVNTRPWSQVFIDGKPFGSTPRMNIALSAGDHSVTFVNDEFSIRKTVSVSIAPGKVETLVLNLTD